MRIFLNFFDVLKSSYAKNKLSCVVPATKTMLRFVKILRKGCLIYGAVLKKEVGILIFLRYSRKKPLISNIKIVSKSSSRKYSRRLKLGGRLTGKVFISTDSDGFKSNAAGKVCSGELICKLW